MRQRRNITLSTLLALILSVGALAHGADSYSLDFESDGDSARFKAKGVEISEGGVDGGKCLVIPGKGKFASVTFPLDGLEVQPGMKLSFDQKVVVESGKVNYVAYPVTSLEKKVTWMSTKPSPEWSHVEVAVEKMKVHSKHKEAGALTPGDKLKAVRIYGRGDSDEARYTVYLDNVKVSK